MQGSITQKTNLHDLQVFHAFFHYSMWAYYISKPKDKLVDYFYEITFSKIKEIFDELTGHTLGLNNRLLVEQNLP